MQEIAKRAPTYPQLKDVDDIWIVETSIWASESHVYFRHFDGSAIVETMVFNKGMLKQRRDHTR